MNRQYKNTLAIVASAAVAAGCSTMAADKTSAYEGSRSSSAMNAASAADSQASQSRIASLETRLADTERRLKMANDDSTASAKKSMNMSSDSSLFPPNPKPGQCYARALIPATYNTVSEQVVVQEPGERFEVVPARFESATERRLVKEASARLEIVPASYNEVQERILVRPASTKIVEIPAVYKTVTERVLDKAAHTVWKKGPAAAQMSSVLSETTTDTGEIMCLVEVPASYKTVEKRVLVTAARTDEVDVPAEYKTVTKTVVAKAATTREIAIPAQYDTVTVTKLVSPATERRIAVPALYDTVSRTSKTSEESMEWRQVVCEVNMTSANVLALQKSLADKGYYKASLDGIIGGQTYAAARSYALAQNLPAGSNYVPIEVVKSLKINF